MGCSPWGLEESDTTERFHFHFSLSCIGEENGNPLQCSCLENPRDRGEWWAAVYGVTQSRTRLKRLSSSSSSKPFSDELCVLSRSVVSDSLQPRGLWPTRFLCPWEFSRQEYWSGLLCPPPGHLPNSGIEPRSPSMQADCLPSEPPGKPRLSDVSFENIFSHSVGCLCLLLMVSFDVQKLFMFKSTELGFLLSVTKTFQNDSVIWYN